MYQRHRYQPRLSFPAGFILLSCLLTLLSSCAKTSDEGSFGGNDAQQLQRGSEIVAEYRKRDSAPNRHALVRMTITSQDQPEKVYEFEIWRKHSPEGTMTLLQVIKPESEKNVASLSTERKGEKSVTVTYNRANNEFEEFGADRQVFGGLTVQEMLGEWDRYESRLVGEQTLDGVKMYQVANTLKPQEISTIKRFVALFRSDNKLPAEAHLFDSQDKEIRTYRIKEYRTIEGHPTFWRIEIENHVRRNKLDLEVLNQSFNERLDEKLFTRENLKRLATA